MRILKSLVLAGISLLLSGTVFAQSSVLVVNANSNNNATLNSALSAQFTTVDNHEMNNDGTPTLQQLSAYNTVIAYTNSSPSDPVGVGDVLADYADAGGCVVLATYSLSTPWAITGRMQDAGYSPLTNVGVTGNVSGNLVALVPTDPVFTGVDLGALLYFENSNFSHPDLDSGALLIGDDGARHNMIARNANGNVVGMNLFPADFGGNNDELYALFVNAAVDCSGNMAPPAPAIPVPANNMYALILMIILLSGVAYTTIRRYKLT